MLTTLIPRLTTAHYFRIACLMLTAAGLTLLPSCSREEPIDQKTPTVWYVDPTHGSDDADGLAKASAWKTFAPLNETTLSPGDRVEIAPGLHATSLIPKAAGSPDQPAVIHFLAGTHEFQAEGATREIYFISNSSTASIKPMPIAILVKDCENLTLTGDGTDGDLRTTLLMGGRLTHFVNDHSENISYRQLVFDLKRPTVSEFRVIGAGESWSDIKIAEGSTCELRDGRLHWTGDLGAGTPLLQQAIPAEGRCWRTRYSNNPLDHATRIEQRTDDTYRLHFEGREPLIVGHQFHYRNGERDVVGAHNARCRNISIEDVEFNAFAGMGIISQFTENISYQRIQVIPPANTLRTCPAWADGFHFSGCRGQILIEDCTFSGLQDDPVNVHGTHLRVIEQPQPNQLLVRFIHRQSYGFAAFQPGDEIAVIHTPTLREHPANPHRTVTAIERINDHDWLLTLDGKAPHFEENDVVDNLSWYADLTIRNCRVDMCPTRGFLVTTRGKVLIENNHLKRCRMPGILIENDASGWFESGPVRDMLIRNNELIGCGIRIHPRVQQGNDPVHENIRIIGNTFGEGAGIEAHHVSGLIIEDNRSDGGELPLKLESKSTWGFYRSGDVEFAIDPSTPLDSSSDTH